MSAEEKERTNEDELNIMISSYGPKSVQIKETVLLRGQWCSW